MLAVAHSPAPAPQRARKRPDRVNPMRQWIGPAGALLCPYCGEKAKLLENSAELYNGRDYGPAWACVPCGAWVGCHPGTRTPLGRLADKELRQAKIAAHAAFDRLWKAKLRREGGRKKLARGAGYKWLAAQLGIEREECHIGMMDVALCRRVVEVCRPFHAEHRAAQP